MTVTQELCGCLTGEPEEFFCWIGILLTALIFNHLHVSLTQFCEPHCQCRSHEHIFTDLIPLEVVPALTPESPSEYLTAGIVITSFIPFDFKSPHFISTLLIWLFANISVIQLPAYGRILEFNHDFGCFMHMFYILPCALPI